MGQHVTLVENPTPGGSVTVDELAFTDPYRGKEIAVKILPIDQLTAIEHQRKPRPAHVENLVGSIERIGFIVPLVAVEEERGGGIHYVVIDGQHRLQAAKSLEVKDVPVIVVPGDLAQRMMNLNVEKDLNIREKSSVSLGIYRAFLEAGPEMSETNPEIVDSIERAYYVTLGIAYEKRARLAGSAFEPLLKKSDSFLDEGIEKCYPIREDRAGAVLEANSLVKKVTEQAKEVGAWHQYFQAQLMSYVDPYKRKRGPLDFDDVFGKVIAKLEGLNEEPDKILRISGGR